MKIHKSWYHGHVRTWEELRKSGPAGKRMMNALTKNGLANRRGKIRI
jgi:hypothetical protein